MEVAGTASEIGPGMSQIDPHPSGSSCYLRPCARKQFLKLLFTHLFKKETPKPKVMLVKDWQMKLLEFLTSISQSLYLTQSFKRFLICVQSCIYRCQQKAPPVLTAHHNHLVICKALRYRLLPLWGEWPGNCFFFFLSLDLYFILFNWVKFNLIR